MDATANQAGSPEAPPASASEPPPRDGDNNNNATSSGSKPSLSGLPEAIPIDPAGDLILDVTFETSSKTTTTAKTSGARKTPAQAATPAPAQTRSMRRAYRVDAATLRRQSRYFEKLLGDARFREAADVAAALDRLAARGVRPRDIVTAADAAELLPWVRVLDDDEATRFPARVREAALAGLLRMLHGRQVEGVEDVGAAGTGTVAATTDKNASPEVKASAKTDASASALTKVSARANANAKTSASASPKVNASRNARTSPNKSANANANARATTNAKTSASTGPSTKQQIDMQFVVALAVLADRFDCAAPVSRWLVMASQSQRFKWPVTTRKAASGRDDLLANIMTRATEEALRQKILVSWLLDLPIRFQNATRELIMNGSRRWSAFAEDEDESLDASWWYLPDGLEQELQYRRHCILNTIASIQRHFLSLYASRSGGRQCKLGYDSSAACDSYQLGEMLKFLTHKNLLFLVDFSPRSLFDTVPDCALVPVIVENGGLLATLRQCPGYQVDKHHSNCGLRTRLLPILDFVQGLLSAGSVPVAAPAWRRDRAAAAWMPPETDDGGAARDSDPRPFCFTRLMLGDQRLRFENALGADKFAREVFTASSWNWTAED
ncbi:hypothetical protein DL766_003319 [Monosporascus sp. MC13-8B]|uniref:Uncharacterized protein n=1 Tax=Monosporascus cannonballus TaxID=155416 RepID=A0ABY0H6M0_9PEZI|nr:hypothetical protein DL762_004836 [Monosporascus cannonballus]RYO93173.1 hypothetical protein DL763_004445 [Monosporascus cannonballus]RYP33690.1 hypothetical protein DL766_003319 [Monosporascus sp. MC13-8B]